METLAIQHARTLWDYQSSFANVSKSDAIVVCCSYDLRVCDFACNLYKSGLAKQVVFSGNTGNWTRHIWTEPEARVFCKRALVNGIDPSAILLEQKATNFGENIRFARELLPEAKSITLVSKPNSLLRVKLTADIHWPEPKITVAAPDIVFPEGVSNVVGMLGLINEMVGDIQRIQKYPSSGYQAPHQYPSAVHEAWKSLIAAGFTEHLMKS